MRFAVNCSLVVILAISAWAPAQNPVQFEFGVRAGIPFTRSLESQLTGPAATFSSQAFGRAPVSAGPAFTVVFFDRLAVEFDAVYKSMTFKNSAFNGTTYTTSSGNVSSWEFPLIADYSFLNGPVRPYGGGGMVLGERLSGRRFLNQLPAYVFNGGLEWRLSRIVVRPELRYTRWSSFPQSTSMARRRNQFEYLVGFSFRGFGH
jgi:hypothetical protein